MTKKMIGSILLDAKAKTDTIDTLNFDTMSDLLKGLVNVAKNLAMTSSSR
jgi:hypothetical protein